MSKNYFSINLVKIRIKTRVRPYHIKTRQNPYHVAILAVGEALGVQSTKFRFESRRTLGKFVHTVLFLFTPLYE